ncbi:MAG TPA: 50S ribosomal protein L31 [Dehalococcoidia bacterium]|jgi:large subunit ribosomal protein L31|nr:50S ribosomal protein L31 [Dehalococcoidia bacterium]
MKSEVHPEYVLTSISCACGFSWETRSTKENLKVDVCSNCHPFFTGEQRIVDTAGRVERFNKRYSRS